MIQYIVYIENLCILVHYCPRSPNQYLKIRWFFFSKNKHSCHRGLINCDFPARNSWITLLCTHAIFSLLLCSVIWDKIIRHNEYNLLSTKLYLSVHWILLGKQKTQNMSLLFGDQWSITKKKKIQKQALLSLHWWIRASDKAVFLPTGYLSLK